MPENERKKPFVSLFEEALGKPSETNGHPYSGFKEEEDEYELEEESPFSLTDEIDHLILMHRDAHFGGDFTIMLDYYQNEDNIGIQPDFDYDRISFLAEIEHSIGHDLAPLILTGAEAEQVGKAKKMYSSLKEFYSYDEKKVLIPQLIADLILSEKEEPEEEIAAIVSQGERVVPDLLRILAADESYDPLFPGYGYAPYLAIICLGEIKDPRAVVPLFEVLGKETVFNEEVILEALGSIGDPAKAFLLKILKSRPLTQDNANAAFANLIFSDDSDVALACFEQLQDPEVRDKPLLRSYLLVNCEQLQETPYWADLVALSSDPTTPKEFRTEIERAIKDWSQ